MGIQFFHYDAFSRIASTSKTKEGHSIYTIAGEADRIKGYYNHIVNPLPPVILHGVSFLEIVQMAEEYADKTKDSCGRKVRKKDFVMIAGVISAPADMSDEIWKIYKQECLKWLIKKWGTSLKSVIEHIDEYHMNEPNILHRHLHFACVPEIGTRFWEIHPGLIAKREADIVYGKSRKPDVLSDEDYKKLLKEYRKAGDIAYRNEMSREQDRFYEFLGEPFGLLRYGPKRLRYSRKEVMEYNKEKRIKQENFIKRTEHENTVLKNAELIISEAEKTKAEANILKIKAERMKAEAQEIKNNAWVVANDITRSAEKEAASIIDKVNNFINNLLNKVSKLAGGTSVIDWARTSMKSLPQSQPEKQPTQKPKGNEKTSGQSR
jgi:hypothetical protein